MVSTIYSDATARRAVYVYGVHCMAHSTTNIYIYIYIYIVTSAFHLASCSRLCSHDNRNNNNNTPCKVGSLSFRLLSDRRSASPRGRISFAPTTIHAPTTHPPIHPPLRDDITSSHRERVK